MNIELKHFERLPHDRGIWNATVPVKEGVRLSVSFDDGMARWAVGTIGSYECAIQINSGHDQGWSLVTVDGQNTWSNCDSDRLDELFKIAEGITLSCSIEVFDQFQGDKQPRWGHRFDCAAGEDEKDKMDWCNRFWGVKQDTMRIKRF